MDMNYFNYHTEELCALYDIICIIKQRGGRNYNSVLYCTQYNTVPNFNIPCISNVFPPPHSPTPPSPELAFSELKYTVDRTDSLANVTTGNTLPELCPLTWFLSSTDGSAAAAKPARQTLVTSEETA